MNKTNASTVPATFTLTSIAVDLAASAKLAPRTVNAKSIFTSTSISVRF